MVPQSVEHSDFFLPDLCDIHSIFAVVVVGELLAFVLALTPATKVYNLWTELALISLFVQWVGLMSAGIVCGLRRPLARAGNATGAVLAWFIVVGVAAATSECAYWLVQQRVLDVHLSAVWEISRNEPWFSQPVLYDTVTATSQHIEFLLRSTAITAIVSAVALRYLYLQHQSHQRARSESVARIQALQSRIRPHFLFNSMNTIASLTRSDPALAEQITEDLADLFRVSLSDAQIPSTMAQEMATAKRYLNIEATRLGERLRLEWATDALPGDAQLPALSLQPLLENAVYHGIEPSSEPATIRLSGEREGDMLSLRISNPPAPSGDTARPGNRYAQNNVRERLNAFFGNIAKLEIEDTGSSYAVTLRIPYLTRPSESDCI